MADVVVFKEIHPKKLREDVFRVKFLSALHEMERDIKKDFQKTTATWKNKPEFESMISLQSPGPTVLVGTDDEIYNYVDKGTKPHTIRPKKRGGKLAFPWGGPGSYRAKTKPKTIASYPGGVTGDTTILPVVHHPGTEARQFSETIAKQWSKKFKARMEKALKEGVSASGHKV